LTDETLDEYCDELLELMKLDRKVEMGKTIEPDDVLEELFFPLFEE